MKILIVSPEAGSWTEHSPLADVVNNFAKAYQRKSAQVLVVSPYFNQRVQKSQTFQSLAEGMESLRLEPYSIWSDGTDGHVYVRQDTHFDRSGIYHDPHQHPYEDNHLRFSFLVSSALHYCQTIGFIPDCIHAHEWATGLAGAMAKGIYQTSFGNVPVILTIHNVLYDFYCPEQDIERIGLPRCDYNMDGYEYWGKVSLLKSAILYAHQIALTSPGYKAHVLGSDLPGGIRGYLEHHSRKLVGIQNGLDYALWSGNDPLSTPELLSRKSELKKALRHAVHLPQSDSLLLYSHLDTESGRSAETLSTILSNIIHLDMQLVVGIEEGTPECDYFRSVAEQNPNRIGVLCLDSNPEKLLRALGGADLLFSVQPAEPSAALILKSLACGTVPLTSQETGCASLLVSYNGENAPLANALLATESSPDHMVRMLKFAVATFADNPEDWKILMQNASNFRYPWDTTVEEYLLTLPSKGL